MVEMFDSGMSEEESGFVVEVFGRERQQSTVAM